MLNYKSSLQNTSHKTNKKDSSILPTMNDFNTENSLSSPKKETRSAQINDIRGSIQGIINDVAKKATDNRTAVETVSSINSQIIDVLSINRSPLKQTSMEQLVDPQQQNGQYHLQDVALSQSVGPYDSRMRNNQNQYIQDNRYKSPSRNLNAYNNNSFGSPIQYKSPIRNEYASPSLTYGSAAKMRSPQQKLTYDETEGGYQRNLQSPFYNNGAKRNITVPSYEEQYNEAANSNYSHLKSPNRIIPQQPLHQFSRDDLILLSQDLRKKLNDEIRRNNALFQKCQELENENNLLRIGSKKSSNHISQTKENGSILRSVKNSGNKGNMEYPSDLWAQLARLKQENERLRSDTVNLLRKH